MSNLFATNPHTSTDPDRINYLNVSGTSSWAEKKYWINKLIYGLSETTVRNQFNIAYTPKIILSQVNKLIHVAAKKFGIGVTKVKNN